MAKEWILNSATNRFQLNFKRNVGAIAEEIRKCAPKDMQEWENYYYENVYPKDHLVELGKKLYIKISEILAFEIEEITEEDCIEYILNLVINRSYDGYVREINTIYGQLQQEISDYKIEAAPDKWDRLYNVDFYIKVNEKYIGIQIKPVSKAPSIPEIFKEKEIQKKSHDKFKKEYGGNVFYIYSCKEGSKKIITNIEIINDIKKEINRLK